MRRCPICGADMAHHRSDAQVCSPACRAELSRVKRLLSGAEADGYQSLADHLEARHKRTSALVEDRSTP